MELLLCTTMVFSCAMFKSLSHSLVRRTSKISQLNKILMVANLSITLTEQWEHPVLKVQARSSPTVSIMRPASFIMWTELSLGGIKKVSSYGQPILSLLAQWQLQEQILVTLISTRRGLKRMFMIRIRVEWRNTKKSTKIMTTVVSSLSPVNLFAREEIKWL